MIRNSIFEKSANFVKVILSNKEIGKVLNEKAETINHPLKNDITSLINQYQSETDIFAISSAIQKAFQPDITVQEVHSIFDQINFDMDANSRIATLSKETLKSSTDISLHLEKMVKEAEQHKSTTTQDFE